MNIILLIFNEGLFRPLFNGLIFLYNVIPYHDLGIAIILLTAIIRLLLYPLNQKSIKSQAALTKIQPQIKEVQEKYKNDRVKQSQALMELYRVNGVNPASGCLPLLIQLPILLALYRVFLSGLDPSKLSSLYSFVLRPETINPMFLGIIDLSKVNIGLAVLAGVLTFVQTKMMQPNQTKDAGKDFSAMLNKQMTYFMPILTLLISLKLPAGLTLYWVATTLFGIGQQYLILRKKNVARTNGDN
jgi:YidC/Oxa1 family membrane protein insertase